jgi:squalene synthase HpnC
MPHAVALAPSSPASARAPELRAAFAECERIARAHYENFTLGSRLLPRHLRRHVAALYAFARTADDFADEEPDRTRALAALAAWERELEACYAGTASHPVFVALADTVRRFALPIELFRDLLAAFRTDVDFRGFATYEELLGYCTRSANPVGRLVLRLFGYADPERDARSDDVCTALQLTNFWQDVAIDLGKGRVYLPLEDLTRFGYEVEDLAARRATPAFRELMAFECARARALFERGRLLAGMVDGMAGREIGLFASGGLAILDRLEAVGYDVFERRPTLSRWAKVGLVARGVLFGGRP